MPLDTLRLILLSLKYILPYAFTALLDKCRALIHAQTYKPVPSPKNIIIAGASFAGIQVAQKLAHSIPSGYRVLLIARNEDFHYVFNFPRYAVLKGHERLGFIPYEGIVRGVPKGSLEVVRGSVVDIGENFVRLEGGESVEYAFLVVATGCAQSAPARLRARTREGACEELRGFQRAIEKAGRIAVVGGGAVGVELVADIKDYYPDKRVTLVHSRDQLLPRFGLKLHEYVVKALERLGVEVLLNERPESLPSNKIEDDGGTSTAQQSLLLKNGKIMDFDLVIPCTGTSPNTALLSTFLPAAISKTTGRISVHPTLQTSSAPKNIFALGDVADTTGPQMARAAFFQAAIVQKNILSLICGRMPSAVYSPRGEIEGAVKLTLGKTHVVLYCQPEKGEEILVTGNGGREDLEIEKAWKMFGGDFRAVRA